MSRGVAESLIKPSVYLSLHAGSRFSMFYLLAFRTMQVRLTRTLLTALGIVIGVAAILAVDITNAMTLASIYNLFDETSGRASLLVEPVASGSDGFDQDLIHKIERFNGVELVAPLITAQTTLAGQEQQLQLGFVGGTFRGGVMVMGVDPIIDPEVHLFHLQEGRLLRPDDKYGAVIGKGIAEESNRTIGDKVMVATPKGEASFKIVGIVDDQGVGRLNNNRVLIAPLAVVQDSFLMPERLTQIDIVVDREISDDATRLEGFKTELEAQLPDAVNLAYPATRGKLISQMVKTYQQGLNFFGMVTIFVGGFLIYNGFAMTVLERTREIGMLRSIGATRRQILVLILMEGIFLALFGSLLGLPVGVIIARGLIHLTATLLDITLHTFIIPPDSIVKSLLIGVTVTLISSFLPAWQGSRVSPLEALRIHAQVDRLSTIRHWLWSIGLMLVIGCYALLNWVLLPQQLVIQVRLVAVFGMLLGAALLVPLVVLFLEPLLRPLFVACYGPEGRLGSSNIQRSRVRTTTTVAALMVGVTMVIALGELSNSLQHDILAWVETTIGGDLRVNSVTPIRPNLEQRLASVPGVKAISPVSFITARLVEPNQDNKPSSVSVKAIDPYSYLQVANFKFADEQDDPAERVEELARGDAVFLATTLTDKYDLQRGDIIVLDTRRGRRPFRVAGVIVDFNAQGNSITISRDDLYSYFGQRHINILTIDTQPDADPNVVKLEIEQRFGHRNNIIVESTADFKQHIQSLMNQSFALLNTLVSIAMLVSSLGVVNTLLMNILERTREIGMLRSLGMRRGQVSRMILSESATMGLIGGAFGCPFGLILSNALVEGMNNIAGYQLTYFFTLMPVLVGIFIALLVSQVAALYPARRATNINIIEAIKHE